jgi:hypothetical protein
MNTTEYRKNIERNFISNLLPKFDYTILKLCFGIYSKIKNDSKNLLNSLVVDTPYLTVGFEKFRHDYYFLQNQMDLPEKYIVFRGK